MRTKTDLRGLVLTTADVGNFGHIDRRSTAHTLTEDGALLVDELELEDGPLTDDVVAAAGFRLGFTPGQTEAARLSATWAGRMRRI